MVDYFTLDNIQQFPKGCVVTIGFFDGVHLAHRHIINKVSEIAKERQLEAVVLTLTPHPKEILSEVGNQGKENQVSKFCAGDFKVITPTDVRIELLKKFGAKIILLIQFDKVLAQTSAKEFFENVIIKKLNAKFLVVGFNTHIGKNREGSVEVIKKLCEFYGVVLFVCEPLLYKGEAISSTRIRECIRGCNFSEAMEMLGYEFFIRARYVRGEGRGRQIGFPTINLNYEDNQLLPPRGVYAVKIRYYDKVFLAMANLGFRPTFMATAGSGTEAYDLEPEAHLSKANLILEAHILEPAYKGEIKLSEQIDIIFLKKIREEIKFMNAQDLVNQLKKDRETVLKLKDTYTQMKNRIQKSVY